MNKVIQNTFALIDYCEFKEEPFVFCHSSDNPHYQGSSGMGRKPDGLKCIIEDILIARDEATLIAFPRGDYGCLTGAFPHGIHSDWILADNTPSNSDFCPIVNRDYISPHDYLIFKPFPMVREFDGPDLLVVFGSGHELKRLLVLLQGQRLKIEKRPATFETGSCDVLALPFINLALGLEDVLLYRHKDESGNCYAENSFVAIIPMTVVMRIGDMLMNAEPGKLPKCQESSFRSQF